MGGSNLLQAVPNHLICLHVLYLYNRLCRPRLY